jgi:hypothetical protein
MYGAQERYEAQLQKYLIVEVRTEKKPEAQILGSAIGMKALEKNPYIKGLDKWLYQNPSKFRKLKEAI